ncbi:MAG: NUDIX hydrolase [Patescibacteria group bacterium]
MTKVGAREVRTPAEAQGVMFLVYKNGRFLVEEVTREASGFYGHVRIPGGKIEQGETAEEAMKREVREELGIDVKSFVFLDTFEDVTLSNNYYVFHAFLVLEYEGELKNQEPEKSNVYWVPVHEAWDALKLASSRCLLCLSEKIIASEG